MEGRLTPRQLFSLLAVVILALASWGAITAWSRKGKEVVVVKVSPSDSQVLVDGKNSRPGKLRLTPGQHTFIAKHTDFEDVSQTVTVGKTTPTIILLPKPLEVVGAKYFRQHPDEQAKHEALGGELADSKGREASRANPFLEKLPVSGAVKGGYYRIDVGLPVAGSTQPAVYITAPSPLTRAFALNYIRTQGYNPADMDIVFNNLVTGFSEGH